MKNILSYNNCKFCGKEIREWICYHVKNKTKYTRIAKSMIRYVDTLVDDRIYRIDLSPSGTGCGEKKRHKPNVVLIE